MMLLLVGGSHQTPIEIREDTPVTVSLPTSLMAESNVEVVIMMQSMVELNFTKGIVTC